MRILYSHRTKSADGQYVHIRALTEALAARGHEVIVVGPGDGTRAPPRRLDVTAGMGARELLPAPVHELAEFAYSARGLQKLAARVGGADVLYERYNLFYHAGVRLARARRLPFILEVNAPLAEERARHGDLALKSLARWSEKSIWRAADAVLPVTGVLADMVEAAGVVPEKITVIQNGVDAAFLEHVDPNPVRARFGLDGKIVLGFTGFVRSWHGAERVIRYIARRQRADLHFLLVGDGTARAELESEARALGVADQLTVTGVVQRDETPGYVAAFDVAIQPAATEYASPLKLFEYMALARPVLAPASANIREILTNRSDSILFSPNDEEDFAAGLDVLIADAELRRTLGEAARATIVRHDLTWAGNARRVEAIGRQLLEKRS